jgi:hypothetical protein
MICWWKSGRSSLDRNREENLGADMPAIRETERWLRTRDVGGIDATVRDYSA